MARWLLDNPDLSVSGTNELDLSRFIGGSFEDEGRKFKYGHGMIAGAFFSRFIYSDWYEDLRRIEPKLYRPEYSAIFTGFKPFEKYERYLRIYQRKEFLFHELGLQLMKPKPWPIKDYMHQLSGTDEQARHFEDVIKKWIPPVDLRSDDLPETFSIMDATKKIQRMDFTYLLNRAGQGWAERAVVAARSEVDVS